MPSLKSISRLRVYANKPLAKPKTSVISPVPIAMSAGSPKARMKSGVKNVAPSTPEAIAVVAKTTEIGSMNQ